MRLAPNALTAGFALLLACGAAAAADDKAAKPQPANPQPPGQGPVTPSRFGQPPADPAYAAYQRGLYITALNLALPQAEKGDAAAQMLAAEIYARGLGVARDVAEATRWYMAAAEKGDPEAQLQAALILLGDKPLDRANANRTEALAMLKAAAGRKHPVAAFNLAQIILADKPGQTGATEALPLFELAAAGNVPDAHYALARFYQTGAGGAPLDNTKALAALLAAAKGGLDTAQLDLATALADGTLAPRDYKAAFVWMKAAAERGNIIAALRLAKLYYFGLGVEGDTVAAAAWYVKAKRAGLTDDALEDMLDGLTDEERATAISRANTLG